MAIWYQKSHLGIDFPDEPKKQEKKAAQRLKYIQAPFHSHTWFRLLVTLITNLFAPLLLEDISTKESSSLLIFVIFIISSVFITHWFGNGISKSVWGDKLKVVYKWLLYVNITVGTLFILSIYFSISNVSQKVKSETANSSPMALTSDSSTQIQRLKLELEIPRDVDISDIYGQSQIFTKNIPDEKWNELKKTAGASFEDRLMFRNDYAIFNLDEEQLSPIDRHILRDGGFKCTVELSGDGYESDFSSHSLYSYVDSSMKLHIPMFILNNLIAQKKIHDEAMKYNFIFASCDLEKDYLIFVHYQ